MKHLTPDAYSLIKGDVVQGGFGALGVTTTGHVVRGTPHPSFAHFNQSMGLNMAAHSEAMTMHRDKRAEHRPSKLSDYHDAMYRAHGYMSTLRDTHHEKGEPGANLVLEYARKHFNEAAAAHKQHHMK